MRTACCSSLTATSVTSFTIQTTPHFRGNIRQDCPPIFSLKAQWRHPHKHGNPHNTYYTTTHMENYHEYSILLKVIKALHYLANIYSALMMRERRMKHTWILLWRQLCFCRMRKLVPYEILIKTPSPYFCIMLYFP